RKDFNSAASVYRRALEITRTQVEDCELQLSLARVLVKAGKRDDARISYERIMDRCAEAEDDFGIPYRLYAAERLIDTGIDSSAALRYLTAEAEARRWRPASQLSLVKALLQKLNNNPESLTDRFAVRLRDAQQMEALAKEFPRVYARLEPVPA